MSTGKELELVFAFMSPPSLVAPQLGPVVDVNDVAARMVKSHVALPAESIGTSCKGSDLPASSCEETPKQTLWYPARGRMYPAPE
ncbi:MAG TPA: hypothetical protein VF749_09370 [Candidatus Acidoferrum sp.]